MEKQASWNRAIWKVRLIVAWRLFKIAFIEIWDVFKAIFTLVSVIVIALLVWAIPIYHAFKFFGIIE